MSYKKPTMLEISFGEPVDIANFSASNASTASGSRNCCYFKP